MGGFLRWWLGLTRLWSVSMTRGERVRGRLPCRSCSHAIYTARGSAGMGAALVHGVVYRYDAGGSWTVSIHLI